MFLKLNLSTRTQRQANEGIDAVIVDSVLAIRKGLTESQNNKDLTPASSPNSKPATSTNSGRLADANTIPALEQNGERGPVHINSDAVA